MNDNLLGVLHREGNAAYKAGDYAKAVEAYSAAAELDPQNHVYLSNRSMAYFAMGKYSEVSVPHVASRSSSR